MDQILFYGLALITLASALGTIFSRNAMYSVLSLVVAFFSLAGLYLLLNAEFVAIVHIIVYAGAIMVLFLFVVMMLNLNLVTTVIRRNIAVRYLAVIIGLILAGVLTYGVQSVAFPPQVEAGGAASGSVKLLGTMLFNEYLLPFELISVLLIATMVGVIILTKKEE